LQTIGAFLVLVFHLAVGPTATDAKQFAQLKGEWTVERVMSEGTELPAEEWKGKKVVFEATESKAKTNTMLFDGRLRTKGKMAWLETKTVTLCSGDRADQIVKMDQEYSCSFEVSGKAMKLFLARVTDPSHRGPRPVGDSKGEGGVLFFLRRS
jgi:hypothetical protein